MKHIVLNSNKWFSAVSDYSLQLALFLKTQISHEKDNISDSILYGTFPKSPMIERCEENRIPYFSLPLYPTKVLSILRSILTLKKMCGKGVVSVWMFEGREQFICALFQILYPIRSRNIHFIRVRGQAQKVKKHFFSFVLYRFFTDRVVFASARLRDFFPFKLPKEKLLLCLYGREAALKEERGLPPSLVLHPHLPSLDLAIPTLTMVGRFDPVKGHRELIRAYTEVSDEMSSQLCLIGRSENISFFQIVQMALFYLKGQLFLSYPYAVIQSDKKAIYIVDEKINVHQIQKYSAFGVISSLGSEVICRVAVEFLQQGTPVLATNVGALPEVVEETFELTELKKKLEEGLEIVTHKSKLYQQLRQKAYKTGLAFDLSRFKSIL